MMLVFLASRANDSGASWYSYSSIQRETGLCRDSIRQQTRYLKNELGILDWRQGGGRSTNRYRLKLEAMEELVRKQAQQLQRAAQQPAPACQADSSVGGSAVGRLPLDRCSRTLESLHPPAERLSPGDQTDTNPHGTLCELAGRTQMEPGPASIHFGKEDRAISGCGAETVAQREAQVQRRAEAHADAQLVPTSGHVAANATRSDGERISNAVTKMGLKNPDAWQNGIQSLVEAGESLDFILSMVESLHAKAPAGMKLIDGSVFAEKMYWLKKSEGLVA